MNPVGDDISLSWQVAHTAELQVRMSEDHPRGTALTLDLPVRVWISQEAYIMDLYAVLSSLRSCISGDRLMIVIVCRTKDLVVMIFYSYFML